MASTAMKVTPWSMNVRLDVPFNIGHLNHTLQPILCAGGRYTLGLQDRASIFKFGRELRSLYFHRWHCEVAGAKRVVQNLQPRLFFIIWIIMRSLKFLDLHRVAFGTDLSPHRFSYYLIYIKEASFKRPFSFSVLLRCIYEEIGTKQIPLGSLLLQQVFWQNSLTGMIFVIAKPLEFFVPF